MSKDQNNLREVRQRQGQISEYLSHLRHENNLLEEQARNMKLRLELPKLRKAIDNMTMKEEYRKTVIDVEKKSWKKPFLWVKFHLRKNKMRNKVSRMVDELRKQKSVAPKE